MFMRLAWLVVVACVATPTTAAETAVWPGETWKTCAPEDVGLDRAQLDALRQLVGGRGCVVRHGQMVYTWGDQAKSSDIASAVKPVISTLLLLAVQEGKLPSVDERVSQVEPRLKPLNNGKDAAITWRQLASQTSGYGLAHAPGEAYSYNDYALALYFDCLMHKVYREEPTQVLKTQLAEPLQFQDEYSFAAFGPNDRTGRMAVSVRDWARFGLLYLRGGQWQGRQIVRPELLHLAIDSPIASTLGVAQVEDAEMLPKQRSLGGNKSITPVGPGFYSFNWWLNRTDRRGRRLFVDAPPDTYVASGHGGKRMLWVIPSLDLICCWNDSKIDDMDAAPGNAKSRCNQAVRFLCAAVTEKAFRPATRVTIDDGRWQINGRVTYAGAKTEGLLMNVRMVNAVYEDPRRKDFDAEANTAEFIEQIPNYAKHGVRAFTLSLQGGMPGYEGAVNSAFAADGSLRENYLQRVASVIEACDREGVAVILGCYYQRQDQILKDEAAVRAGVASVAKWLHDRGYTNVLLEIANEFPHGGFNHKLLRTPAGQVELIELARKTAPGLLVSTSGIGDGKLPGAVAAASDFLLPHFNGMKIDQIESAMRQLAKFEKPIVCNEDDRTGEEAVQAMERAIAGGASYGLMLQSLNQRYPFTFGGADDDAIFYRALQQHTSPSR